MSVVGSKEWALEAQKKKISDYMSSHGFDSDDAYLKSIEQYKDNEELYNYLLTNPWMYSKNTYIPTFSQSLSESFGDFSSRGRHYADLLAQQNQFVTEGVEKFRQQDYNSPLAQVQREQAAGLNPSLSPDMISPGSASENDQPNLPSPSMGDSSSLAEFGNGVLSFIGNIFSFGQMIQGLSLSNQNIITADLSNHSSAFDFVANQIGSLVPLRKKNDKGEDVDLTPEERLSMVSTSSFDDWLDAASKLDYSGFNPSTRKLISKYYGFLKRGDSLAVEAVKSRLEKMILTDKKESASIMGSPVYDDDFNKWIQNFMSKVGNIEYDVWHAEMAAQKKGAEASEVDAEVEKAKENAWNTLYKAVQGPKWYNTAAMIFIPILRMYLERGFSFSKSESHSMGRNGVSNSQSRSFSF